MDSAAPFLGTQLTSAFSQLSQVLELEQPPLLLRPKMKTLPQAARNSRMYSKVPAQKKGQRPIKPNTENLGESISLFTHPCFPLPIRSWAAAFP